MGGNSIYQTSDWFQLLKASSQLEISRLKLRLMLELKLVNETKLFQAQAKLQEIGRMLGGWYGQLIKNSPDKKSGEK